MQTQPSITINHRRIGPGNPTYIIAEMSANHNQDFEQATKIVHEAKKAGADAIKLQTYTPDSLTINCNTAPFQIQDTIWKGKTLYQLYEEAYTPWEWQPKLQSLANELGLDFFSTPFDTSAIEFLNTLEVPAFKIASFENNDLPFLALVAQKKKPVILSTGMASLGEIEEAVETLRENGCNEIVLLKCTSAYPASPSEMNLTTIRHLAEAFHIPVGFSDHTLGITVPVTAVVLGASLIEKHFTLSRDLAGPDSAFSLEPGEFKEMVYAIRTAEEAMGTVSYGLSEKEEKSRVFRRSLFAVKDIIAGELLTTANVRSIRPAHGLAPKYLAAVLGKHAKNDIKLGTPLRWELIG